MEPNGIRPDPDELLKQVEDEERKQTRGKLKVFLGYSAGVGKTYTMLEEAQIQQILLQNGVLTVNEVRRMRGLGEMAGKSQNL